MIFACPSWTWAAQEGRASDWHSRDRLRPAETQARASAPFESRCAESDTARCWDMTMEVRKSCEREAFATERAATKCFTQNGKLPGAATDAPLRQPTATSRRFSMINSPSLSGHADLIELDVDPSITPCYAVPCLTSRNSLFRVGAVSVVVLRLVSRISDQRARWARVGPPPQRTCSHGLRLCPFAPNAARR